MNHLILGGVFALAIVAGYYATEPEFDPERLADFGVAIPSPQRIAVRAQRSDAQVAEALVQADRASERLRTEVEASLNH